jgi:N-acetylglutamate synthase-like GNAT family acetyltransferase
MTIRTEYLADQESHLPQVAQWQHAQFGYLNPAGTLEQRASRLRDALHRDRVPMALIAISEAGQLVGSASILAATLTHQHLTPWLSSVFVPPEMRGRSIASVLSLRAVDEAARLGFKTLYLFTPHNESLYARLGWKTFDRTVHNGQPLTLMERPVGA